MRRLCLTPLFLAAVALSASVAPAGDAAKADRDAIQGTWVPVAAVVYGKERSPEELKMTYAYRFEGDKLVALSAAPDRIAKDKGSVGGYKLDESKNPKWLDMHPGEELHTPDAHGVYQLDGDTLRLCVRYGDAARPTDFRPLDDNYVLTYKRMKPPAIQPAPKE